MRYTEPTRGRKDAGLRTAWVTHVQRPKHSGCAYDSPGGYSKQLFAGWRDIYV